MHTQRASRSCPAWLELKQCTTGMLLSQALIRTRLIAAPVSWCWRLVLAMPQ